jgi:hypothetical protein
MKSTTQVRITGYEAERFSATSTDQKFGKGAHGEVAKALDVSAPAYGLSPGPWDGKGSTGRSRAVLANITAIFLSCCT